MSGGKAGEQAVAEDGHTHESACLNCATPLVGSHCHACGQPAHVHKTLAAFFHDLLHGVFHFEGKIWRTLPLLAWRPGKLTREYIDGRRASYISPIALFLFVTFLTFAAFNTLGDPIRFGDVVRPDGEKRSFAQAESDLARQLEQLRARRIVALAAGKHVAAIDRDIEVAEQNRTALHALNTGDLKAVTDRARTPDSSGNARIDALWAKARSNPDLLLYKLQSNAYKYSWMLIPISMPFVWLLFAWRRRFGVYDHTVFVTYSLCFMLLALTVASVGSALGWSWLVLAPLLYAPFHLYRQLRETYALSRGGAVVRTALLGGFGAVALVLWAFALLALLLGE